MANWKKIKEDIVEEVFRFPGYMMGNPFKAFSDIKYEGRGSVKACVFFFVLLCINSVLQATKTGWIVNTTNTRTFNVWATIAGVIVTSLLVAVANWSVSVLTDGSGKFKEIFMVVMYAQYPSIWLSWAYIILSNVLTLDEMAFATFCTTLGIVCMVFYGFIGLVSVHGFGFGKGIASVIFTAIAIVIILFIVLLIATMAGELVTFVSTVAKEITLNYF
jgi:hypothetical protein